MAGEGATAGGAVVHGAVAHGAVAHGAVAHDAVAHDAVAHGAVAHDAVAHDADADGAAPLPLLRAAAALRWSRPDLTAALAEVALDAAPDAVTWVTAAGWLLHGRAAVGDGRATACSVLDALSRGDGLGPELLHGPAGSRLRVELAAVVHHGGDPAVAGALLPDDEEIDHTDGALRADALTGRARCALHGSPGAADDALRAAHRAWMTIGCAAGAASVVLLAASRHRRAGQPEAAATSAAGGVQLIGGQGDRPTLSRSHPIAAALVAEWVTALVETDRAEQARTEVLPAADALIAVLHPGRRRARLRLAVARVAAATEAPEAVLAAAEAAVRDAALSDVPELESEGWLVLADLHEAAGRPDAALPAVRAALAAERRAGERATRLRAHLSAAGLTGPTRAADRWRAQRATAPGMQGEPAQEPTHERYGSAPQGSGRRPRHREPDGTGAGPPDDTGTPDVDPSGSGPRHPAGIGAPGAEPGATGTPGTESVSPPADPDARSGPAARASRAGTGRRRAATEDVGMADLLADALAAYRTL